MADGWAGLGSEHGGGHRPPARALRGAEQTRGRHFRAEQSAADGSLSDRQREIVQLVALGLSGPEIAAELQIAHETVRTHVRTAKERLGARSRAHLVAKALGEGHV